jgi:hypothetical protein
VALSLDLVALPGSPERKQQGRDAQKVLRLLAHRLKSIGFERTKSSFFTRPQPWVIEFIHLHKYTFGPYFRTHLGIRVQSDVWSAVALNGPTADVAYGEGGSWARRFEFAPDPASLHKCTNDLADYLSTDGLSWFESVRDPNFLLTAADSPLYDQEKIALSASVNECHQYATSDATRKALNVA